MDNQGIRPYGPGKFATILDSYVYQVSLDAGCDEESGDVSETGRWYGLMRHGRTIFRDHDPFLEPLNDDEKTCLMECVGVVLSEDSQGFVDVVFYENEHDLDKAWSEIIEQEEIAE